MCFLPKARALAAPSSQRYLAPTGSDLNNDCSNLATPCQTWQHVLNTAQAGDSILAAAGIYTDITASNAVSQVAVISQSVAIQGGYNTTFTDPPDPTANPTILDAQGRGRVLTIQDAGQVTIRGLHLTGGTMSGQNNRGGGVYAINSTLTLADNIFDNNQAGYGGGIYLQNSQVQLSNNVFRNNRAQISGGAIRCYDCTGNIINNQVLSNTAVLHGGGLQITNSPLLLQSNQVQSNQVSTGATGWGGGLHIHNSNATLIRNNIIGNIAYKGGGLRLINSPATLQGNVFYNNEAAIGAGLSMESQSNAFLENNAFVNNITPSSGSGIYILDTQPTFQHTTMNGNGETAVLVEGHGEVHMQNSLIANQTNGLINNGQAVTLTTTLWDNVTTPTTGSAHQTGSITGTAEFAADGYHLTVASDARNNAVPSTTAIDIDQQLRPHLGQADIGADEWWALDARKTVSHQFAQPGDTITYTIILTNTVVTTTNVLLTDTLPSQVDYLGPISATSGSASFSNGDILWQGSLSEQESVTIVWPVQIQSDIQVGTSIPNTALIQDEQGIYNTTTAVTIVPAEVYFPLIMK